MAFCKYCGIKLEEGETCNCREPKSVLEESVPNTVAEETTSEKIAEEGFSAESLTEAAAVTPESIEATEDDSKADLEVDSEIVSEADSKINSEVALNVASEQEKAEEKFELPGNEKNEKLEKVKHFLITYMKKVGEACKSMGCILKAPATGSAAFIAAQPLEESIILILLQALLSGIFAASVCGRINGIIQTLFYAFLLSGASGYCFNLFLAFIVTLVFSLVFSLCFALLIWVFGLAMKKEMNFQKSLVITALRASILIPIILLSILFFLLNPIAGIGLFAMGSVLAWFFLSAVLKEADFVSANASGYFWMLLFVLMLLLFIGLVFGCNGYTLYLPTNLRDYTLATLLKLFM